MLDRSASEPCCSRQHQRGEGGPRSGPIHISAAAPAGGSLGVYLIAASSNCTAMIHTAEPSALHSIDAMQHGVDFLAVRLEDAAIAAMKNPPDSSSRHIDRPRSPPPPPTLYIVCCSKLLLLNDVAWSVFLGCAIGGCCNSCNEESSRQEQQRKY